MNSSPARGIISWMQEQNRGLNRLELALAFPILFKLTRCLEECCRSVAGPGLGLCPPRALGGWVVLGHRQQPPPSRCLRLYEDKGRAHNPHRFPGRPRYSECGVQVLQHSLHSPCEMTGLAVTPFPEFRTNFSRTALSLPIHAQA